MQQVATEIEELSLAERAYRAIRDRLVMLEIRPGAPINEEQLGQSLGVGRTPVREALKRLQYERLITTYPRRGTFATAHENRRINCVKIAVGRLPICIVNQCGFHLILRRTLFGSDPKCYVSGCPHGPEGAFQCHQGRVGSR